MYPTPKRKYPSDVDLADDVEFGEPEISDLWRLCDHLTVKQASLLLVGIDPASETGTYCEGWKPHERPKGYEAVKQAISSGLRGGTIKGANELAQSQIDQFEFVDVPFSTDPERSSVERDSLVAWLEKRGVRSKFFFPDAINAPDYLDPSNPRYAPKLAAAVRAWLAVTDPGAKSPKQALDKWLRENAASFGLTDDDGNPINNAIEECSKVANWQPGGGVPKTPGG